MSATSDFESRDGFLTVFPELVERILRCVADRGAGEEAVEWQRRLMEYTVPGGKLNRGCAVVSAFQAVRPDASEAEVKEAAVLGWCVEWLQAFFLVADDIMDASETRRGAPCWYKLKEVGNVAINDAFVLEAHVYLILKEYFSDRPCYGALMELFRDISWSTELGQQLDLTSTPAGAEVDFKRFSEERYHKIILLKTAWYSFYLPVALALTLAGHHDARTLELARSILLSTGELFQMQDDILDCYGDPEVIGKVGTDIQDGKCTWLAVEALKIASPEQIDVLADNYGKHDPECVERVKEIYRQLEIETRFRDFEKRQDEKLQQAIKDAAEETKLPPQIFGFLLDKIRGRKK